MLQRRRPMQLIIMRPCATQLLVSKLGTFILHHRRNLRARLATLVPSTVEESKVLSARSFTREPETSGVGTQVLVHQERRTERPVGVAAVGPGRLRPARVGDGCGFGDGGVGEHLGEDGEQLPFSLFVGLLLDAVRLVADDSGEDDVGAW